MTRTLTGLGLAAALTTALALPALADNPAVEARQGQFKLYSFNVGVLAGMAQGEMEYDAEMAQTAADNLYHLTRHDQSRLWPEGTDNESIDNTRALPAIWDDLEGFANRFGALQEAAATMQDAAGTDLASLQGALGGLGGACQACHQEFRGPAD